MFVGPLKRQKLLVPFKLVPFSTRYEVKPFHAVAAAAVAAAAVSAAAVAAVAAAAAPDIFLLF